MAIALLKVMTRVNKSNEWYLTSDMHLQQQHVTNHGLFVKIGAMKNEKNVHFMLHAIIRMRACHLSIYLCALGSIIIIILISMYKGRDLAPFLFSENEHHDLTDTFCQLSASAQLATRTQVFLRDYNIVDTQSLT